MTTEGRGKPIRSSRRRTHRSDDVPSVHWGHVVDGASREGGWLVRLAQRHPQSRDHARWFLARHTLPELVGIFALAVAAFGLLAAIGYKATETTAEQHSLIRWWLESFGALAGNSFGASTGKDGGTEARPVVQAATSFVGAVIPALFLGSVVFKAFVGKPVFVARNRVAIMPNLERDGLEPGGHHLAIRVYSATRLRLVGISAAVGLHVTLDRNNARYYQLDLRTNRAWPLAQTHVPYTIRVPLKRGDLVGNPDDLRLVSVQGNPFSDDDWLMLTITARTPELGGDFAETHVIFRDQVSMRPYSDVQTDPASPSTTWSGWKDFDE